MGVWYSLFIKTASPPMGCELRERCYDDFAAYYEQLFGETSSVF